MTSILLVGATGRVGQRIAKELLNRGVKLHLLVRPQTANNPQKEPLLDSFIQSGAHIVEGDVLSPESLKPAVEGIDVVVSALRGSRKLLVEGQTTLAQIAKKTGVRSIIPSAFSSELFDIDFSDNNIANNFIFQVRREAAQSIASTGLPATHIMNGTLMGSMLNFSPLSPFNLEENTFNYWGDGKQPAAYTTLADVAKYTAEVAIDSNPPDRLRIAGDILTIKEMKQAYEQVTGRKLTNHHLGSMEDLRVEIARRKEKAESPIDYVFHQIRYAIASGAGSLSPLNNNRYPTIQPMTFEGFLKTN